MIDARVAGFSAPIVGNGEFPIMWTMGGVTFVDTLEQQQHWQALNDRFEARMVAAMLRHKKPNRPISKQLRECISDNMFSAYRAA